MGDLDQARAAIRDALEHRTRGPRGGTTGPGPAPLYLHVMGADEPVARELHERFGNLIEIEVAGHPYPFDTSVAVPPGPVREANASDYGLTTSTVLDPAFAVGVSAGDIITGWVHISNASTSRIEWRLGDSIAEGDLCNAAGNVVNVANTKAMHVDMPVVVNVRNSRGRGVGGGIRLDPGESCPMRFTASTDSRDPQVGAVLQSGDYQLFVAIGVVGVRAGEEFEVVCSSVPVRVNDRT